MRMIPGASRAWLLGCVLGGLGCAEPASPTDPAAPSTHEPTAVQAVHHARQEVRPVLTWRENPSPTVPMSLTASDGSGLDLVAMKARVVIEDPLAFTELHLTFDNPEDRRREGRFEIDLPPGAALSRLSMKIGDHFQEGEVVERGKARRTFEDFMHERPEVDPALLENDAANRVRARVFPILPHERKEIIVSFSQELGSAPYRLPLQGLSTVEDFDARVVVKTHDGTRDRSSMSGMASAQRVVELQRSHFTPEEDLVIELSGASPAAGLHAEDLAVVRVRPEADRPITPPASLLVLFDTSASASAGFEDRVEQLGAALHTMAAARDFRVRVVGFDQVRHAIYEGMASTMPVDALADLVEGRALGASDLSAALTEASEGEGRWERVLLVSDGVATAGPTDRGELRAAVRTLEAVGVRRLDALAPGARQDRERLGDLTSALPEAGVVVDDQGAPEAIAQALTQAPFGAVGLTVDGATWSWPETLEGVQPGGDVLVFARYERARPPVVRVRFSDPSLPAQEVETLEVERPLVERAWARARIARIQHRRARLPADAAEAREALDARVVDLSTHYRVLTDLTALLVLESEADYRRFRIDRRGKADLLAVDGGSVRLMQRSEHGRRPLPVDEDLVALATETEEIVEEPPPDDDEDDRSDWSSSRHRGEEGRMGRPTPKAGLFSMRGPSASDRDHDVWGGLTGTEIGESFGTPGLGLGGAELVGKGSGAPLDGGWADTDASEVLGSGGLGLSGTGRGGGGTGEGTIGLGNHGLIGRGGGGGSSGSGSGYGRGSGAGFGGRGTRVPMVRQAKPQVTGGLDRELVRRIVRAHINEVRYCYNQGLQTNPSLDGTVQLEFSIGPNGTVTSSAIGPSTLVDETVTTCIARAARRWKFPKPTSAGLVLVKMPLSFSAGGGAVIPSPQTSRSSGRGMMWARAPRRRVEQAAHTGRFAETQRLLAAGQTDAAYDLAWTWVQTQPSDVLGLLALGDVLEQRERPALAARVYGSLIDLHPSRADIRRAAGERLERLGEPGLDLAIDSYAKAVASRPDHPSGARLHAWALVQRGDHEQAFDVLHAAVSRSYPAGRFAGVKTLMRQDLALIAAAWLAQTQGDAHVRARAEIAASGVHPATEASTRFVVTWETDTTDVDVLLHTPGSRRNHGRRIADVRTGYGPEARVMQGDRMPAEVQASVRYFDRSSQGHAMGTVHIVSHDGQGRVRVQARPFVLMQQRGVLPLGTIDTSAA